MGPRKDVVAPWLLAGEGIPSLAVGFGLPASMQLKYYGGPDWGCCFCSVKIEPESFPPGQTIILPESTVGVIHVESSTNLVQWQDEWVHTFSNTNQNRFFRLRAERL